MNYDSLTDFELECRLHELLTGIAPVKEPSEKQHLYIAYDGDNEHYRYITVPQYCYYWNETMPLLKKFGISFDVVSRGTKCMYRASFGDLFPDFNSYHENPLRAIVVSLLKRIDSVLNRE